MFKRLVISLVLILAVLVGFFGTQMGMGHDEEPMSQACAAHCLDAALTNYDAPVVTPEVFSVFGLLLVVAAGWTLFARQEGNGLLGFLGRLRLLGFTDRLQHVRSTIFRE